MNHPTEEQLILHYYSEADDLAGLEQHLEGCDSCRRFYESVQRTLDGLDALPAPEPGLGYEAKLWARIQPRLPVRGRFRFVPAWRWAAASVAFACVLIAAFLVGRYSRPVPRPVAMSAAPREGALEIAIGDHLERSQMVLTELANANDSGPVDISFEQQRAADLLDENRLYRQSAAGAGDAVVAGVLDDLERILLEIEHAPARISPAELDALRLRVRAEGILFELRVLDSNAQNRARSIRKPL